MSSLRVAANSWNIVGYANADIITGDSHNSVRGNTIANAVIISDFTDGTDVLRLADGLRFTDLNISQGTGSNATDAILRVASTGEYLAIIKAISASLITQTDFE